MQRVYHLVVPSTWEKDPTMDYWADSLTTEGFIHCSLADQVAGSANRFYAGADDLLLLEIDPARLTSPLRHEPAGSGELFPHVYGSINRSAVVAVHAMMRDGNGQWVFPR
jgi:uncharacterized protein (DUF952 family)